jgi:hypothetical protein
MYSPWTILGWILVAIVSIPIGISLAAAAVFVIGLALSFFKQWRAWRKTRRQLPVVGDKWSNRWATFDLTQSTADTISICSHSGSSMSGQGFTPDSWRKWVDDNWAYKEQLDA